MTIISTQAHDQAADLSRMDDSALAALEGLCTALSISESSVLTERQVTAAKCEDVMANMMRKFRELSEMNQRLQAQLILSDSRLHEREIVHVSETLTAQQEIERLHEEVNAMRQAMVASERSSQEQITVLIAQNTEAVRLATEANDERVALLQQQIETIQREADCRVGAAVTEKEAAIRMTHQAADARVTAAEAKCQSEEHRAAVAKQEADLARQELARHELERVHIAAVAKQKADLARQQELERVQRRDERNRRL